MKRLLILALALACAAVEARGVSVARPSFSPARPAFTAPRTPTPSVPKAPAPVTRPAAPVDTASTAGASTSMFSWWPAFVAAFAGSAAGNAAADAAKKPEQPASAPKQ